MTSPLNHSAPNNPKTSSTSIMLSAASGSPAPLTVDTQDRSYVKVVAGGDALEEIAAELHAQRLPSQQK
jgi:hypothetical protein